MKGFKVFDPDWTCRGFQFEVGKVFEEDVDPRGCERGSCLRRLLILGAGSFSRTTSILV